MISFLNSCEKLCFNKQGCIETKIRANDLSYGRGFSFLSIWAEKEGNEVYTVICKFEDTVFISASEKTNYPQLKEFLQTVGFSSVQASPRVISRLGFSSFKTFSCLSLEKTSQKTVSPTCDSSLSFIKSAYDVLYSAPEKNLQPVDFEGFYVDISHRIRHGTAYIEAYKESSVALISHIDGCSAVISGVMTLKEKRGLGYGSELLKKIAQKFSSKKLFVITDEATENFYKINGFKKTEEIGIYRR